MDIIQIIIVTVFLTITPLTSLYLAPKKSNITFFIIGIFSAFILNNLLPKGIYEATFLIATFGLFFSFYKIFELKSLEKERLDILDIKIFQIVYWIISGVFIFTSIKVLFNLIKVGQFNLLYVLLLSASLFLWSAFWRKIEIYYSFKSFISSLIALSIPGVFKMFVGFDDFLIHEIMHLNDTSVFLYPDHSFFDPDFYTKVGLIFFNKTVTSFLSVTFLILLLLLILMKLYWKNIGFNEFHSNVEKRKKRAFVKKIWRKEILISVFCILILFNSIMIDSNSETINNSPYFPVSSNNMEQISINLNKPLYQIEEGQIRKYVFNWKRKSINFVIIRWHNKLKTFLDYCEVCKDKGEGYNLRNNQLVCSVCQTPIDPNTLGVKGGCNPVPLKSKINKFTVIINLKDLIYSYKPDKR